MRGEKTMTTRSREYEPGTYRVLGTTCQIVIFRIRPETLGNIAEKFYKREGCDSPAEFIAIWKRLHRGHWNPKNVRWLHEFRLAR